MKAIYIPEKGDYCWYKNRLCKVISVSETRREVEFLRLRDTKKFYATFDRFEWDFDNEEWEVT